jgi:hypothetical protein
VQCEEGIGPLLTVFGAAEDRLRSEGSRGSA